MRKWWEKENVRFEWQLQCFKCCQKPGAVFFSHKDIGQAAKLLNRSSEQFQSEYLDL